MEEQNLTEKKNLDYFERTLIQKNVKKFERTAFKIKKNEFQKIVFWSNISNFCPKLFLQNFITLFKYLSRFWFDWQNNFDLLLNLNLIEQTIFCSWIWIIRTVLNCICICLKSVSKQAFTICGLKKSFFQLFCKKIDNYHYLFLNIVFVSVQKQNSK